MSKNSYICALSKHNTQRERVCIFAQRDKAKSSRTLRQCRWSCFSLCRQSNPVNPLRESFSHLRGTEPPIITHCFRVFPRPSTTRKTTADLIPSNGIVRGNSVQSNVQKKNLDGLISSTKYLIFNDWPYFSTQSPRRTNTTFISVL